MVQANELKIGNWVSFLKEPYKVAIDDIVHLAHVDDPRFEPLQISPEILEKAATHLRLKYVHELQNLIHSLTGSELPLNL